MKTVKITHAFGTIKIAPSGGGQTRDEVDALVNAKMAEGYDDVEVILVHSNFDANGQQTDVVNQYIFRKYGEDGPVEEVLSRTLPEVEVTKKKSKEA